MAMLLITRDATGIPAWGLDFTSDAYNVTLAANTEKTITVPSSNTKGYLAVFSYQPGSSVWVSNATITLPTGTVAQSVSQLNPGPKNVAAGSTIYLKTSDTSTQVGVALYELTQ